MKSALHTAQIPGEKGIVSGKAVLLQEKQQQIPGSFFYRIRRYQRPPDWSESDTGMLVYHFAEGKEKEQYLELRFCVSGNKYCREKQTECDHCRITDAPKCVERFDTVDVLSFRFQPDQLHRLIANDGSEAMNEHIIRFAHNQSFTRTFPVCNRTKNVLGGMLNHTYSGSFENIYFNAQTQMLLLYSMECLAGDKHDSFRSKFLRNPDDREKIIKAREILLQHIGEPLTIKHLSRKVAINECYLKKGFKELFGQTIFDFYQGQRMEHAKYLLYEKGLSVTDVSSMLGYSSISHFSTAFKKHTGLKPCELLFK
ncbi:MAG: helix-turn-helix transcriptional regulator [Dinghuibacter sp.]|nr:helix-turn-helix transcriptional regulator [Dinghuibacter sp.]